MNIMSLCLSLDGRQGKQLNFCLDVVIDRPMEVVFLQSINTHLLFYVVPPNIMLGFFLKDQDLLLWVYYGLNSRICLPFRASKKSGFCIFTSACHFVSDSPSFLLLPHTLLQLLGASGVMQVVKFNSSRLIPAIFRQRSA